MTDRSKAYANFAEESYSWKFIERPALERAIPAHSYNDTVKVLDIGSGSGRVVNYHVQNGAHSSNILGVDPDPARITLTRERFPKAQFINKKIQDVELVTNSIDLATAVLSLRYLNNDNLAATFRKVADALRPGGLFWLLDVHPARYGVSDGFDKYFQEGVREVATPWGGSELYYYRTISMYVTALAEAGLTLVALDECPIAEEGTQKLHNADFARYNISPSRFAVLVTR